MTSSRRWTQLISRLGRTLVALGAVVVATTSAQVRAQSLEATSADQNARVIVKLKP